MVNLKVGDTVQVISGAERSAAQKAAKRGKLMAIDAVGLRVRVEGLRLVKRHLKKGRDQSNPDGGIIEKVGNIALSSVALVCPKCDKPTRVGIKVTPTPGERKKTKRERFCRKCDAKID
jgi:large subunit ribosomal protein L24